LPNINWRARCDHPLYVGEFDTVLLNDFGAAHLLLLDVGVMFTIPADIGRATWGRLCRGDLISVRWNIPGTSPLPVALSVDALDGRTSIASNRIAHSEICETRDRRLSQPRSRPGWKQYGIAGSGSSNSKFLSY
jgi:hypothetical protein